MAPFLLTEKDVEGLLRMDDALAAVEEGLGALGRGDATNRPRQRVGTREATVNVMLASWPGRGYAGFKYYTTSRAGIRFWVHLVDIATGELVAVIQADRLGQQRTGAAYGVATKYLARSDASTVGIVGTGWQAESQLEAVCAVRSVQRVRCFGRDKAHREAFAKKMSSVLGVNVEVATSGKSSRAKSVGGRTTTISRCSSLTGSRLRMSRWLRSCTSAHATGESASRCPSDNHGRADIRIKDRIDSVRIRSIDRCVTAPSRGGAQDTGSPD